MPFDETIDSRKEVVHSSLSINLFALEMYINSLDECEWVQKQIETFKTLLEYVDNFWITMQFSETNDQDPNFTCSKNEIKVRISSMIAFIVAQFQASLVV